MADTGFDPAAPLPFSNLDDIHAPLLAGTGATGRRTIERLLASPSQLGTFQGKALLTTPAGKLVVYLERSGPGGQERRMRLSLQTDDRHGYVAGEWYAHGVTLPATTCIAAAGRRLSELCETPPGFPGRDRTIRRVRCLTASTRVSIEHTSASMTLADFEDPSRPRAPRKKEGCA